MEMYNNYQVIVIINNEQRLFAQRFFVILMEKQKMDEGIMEMEDENGRILLLLFLFIKKQKEKGQYVNGE